MIVSTITEYQNVYFKFVITYHVSNSLYSLGHSSLPPSTLAWALPLTVGKVSSTLFNLRFFVFDEYQ
jgi:lipid-A-disaccharide synthase-like uncharacterized protein